MTFSIIMCIENKSPISVERLLKKIAKKQQLFVCLAFTSFCIYGKESEHHSGIYIYMYIVYYMLRE